MWGGVTLVSFSHTTERNTCSSCTHLLQFLNLKKKEVRNRLRVIHADARVSLAAAASGSCRSPATTDQSQVEGGSLSPPFWPLQTRRVKLQFSLLSSSQPNAFRDNRRLNGRSKPAGIRASVVFFRRLQRFFLASQEPSCASSCGVTSQRCC